MKAKKTKRSTASTDKKRAWARDWMKTAEKVTIGSVNAAVKKQFGEAFGKKVVSELVREHKGGSKATAKSTTKPAPVEGKALRKSVVTNWDLLGKYPALTPLIPRLRDAGVKSILLPDGQTLDLVALYNNG